MTKLLETKGCHFHPPRFYRRDNATRRVAVAVSACLAGERVRYDGIDKLLPVYPLLREALTLIPVCPETGAGLGVPRPPVHLVQIGNQMRARGREDSSLDVTSALEGFAARSFRRLLNEHSLCGYLWKSRSPSCGFGSTPLFNVDGLKISHTSGIQADYFRRHLPQLSYSEESALVTAAATASFVLRCRLVFDLLYTPETSLKALHLHYTFLHENFDKHIADTLDTSYAANNETNYVTAFLAGCSLIPEDVLLKLFS